MAKVVDAYSILTKYTYGGDANLDGQINVGRLRPHRLSTSLWASPAISTATSITTARSTWTITAIIDFNVGIHGPPPASTSAAAAAAIASEVRPPQGFSWATPLRVQNTIEDESTIDLDVLA
jgi:hypothetical protein